MDNNFDEENLNNTPEEAVPNVPAEGQALRGGRFNQDHTGSSTGSSTKNDDLGAAKSQSYNPNEKSTSKEAYTPSASGNLNRQSRRGNGKLYAGVTAVALVVSSAGGYLGTKLAGQNQASTVLSPTATVTTASPSSAQNSSAISSSNGNGNIQSILAKVEPAIVDVSTTGFQSSGIFGGTSQFQAAGTGMIISSSGEVLTNAHVVANASSINVTLLGKTTSYTATVIGSNPAHDVALLQIHGASNLPTVTFGNSNQIQVGDNVVAIGNALALQGLPTVTQGIVSGLNRSLPTNTTTLNNLIQTDAPINPGNSGGPLVNSSGQVIGMNTAIISSTGTEPAQNIGFAESISSVLPIVAQIQAHPNPPSASATASSRGYLGVAVQNLTSPLALQLGLPATATGALVDQVTPGSPAYNAGISSGSVITKVDSTIVTSDALLVTVVQSHKAGDNISVTWENSNGTSTANVTLAPVPTA